MTRPKPQLKYQTVRTPLGVQISAEESSSARRLSSRAPSSRSVNSPYSVVSGLETPTRTGSCKTLEVPNLDTIDLNSSDDDIASVSHNKLSSEERLAKEIEEDETPPSKTKTPRSQLSTEKIKRGSKEPGSISATSQKHAGASQSEKETHSSQTHTSNVAGRGCSKTALTVKTTPIIIERCGKLNTFKNKTPQSTSMTEKVKKYTWGKSPATTSNWNPLTEVFTHKGDVYDLEESSESEEPAPKHPNLETFEKFVEENKLEMLRKNQRRRLHIEDSNEDVGLVKEITNALGRKASIPLTRGRNRGRNATASDEKARAIKNDGNDKPITEVPFILQNDSQDALLKPPSTKELEHIANNDERPIGLTRSGKRFSQSPVNEEEGSSSKKARGKPPALRGSDKGRPSSTNRKNKKAKTAVINKDKQKEVEEANENEILAGSSDIIQSLQLSQGKTPTPTRTQFEINASQEDLLADLSPIHAPDDAQAVSQSQEGQDRILHQCPSAQSTAILLESARSLHPGPEKIDASRLISEVFPKQTPKMAVITPFSQLQERLHFLRATPERARSANASPDVQSLPFSIPKIPTPIIEGEEESISKSMENSNDRNKMAESEERPVLDDIPHLPPVDLDDMEVTPIGKTETNAPLNEEANIFATPIQPAPRSGTRHSTIRTSRRGIKNSTTGRTTSFSSRGSQSLSRSNISPLFMSPLTRLEAAVNALESTEEKKKLTLNQGDFLPSRQLYDPNVSYLLDHSPSVLSQEHQTKTPPPGGLIVPAFGNKYYNITSKSAVLAKVEDCDTKVNETALQKQPPKTTKKTTTGSARTVNKGNSRRFFTSTFAERNKREVERHFFEVVGELSDPSTPKTGGRQLKSGKKTADASVAKRQVKNRRKPKRQTKKTKSKIKLSFLEDTQTDNNSDVDSVPRSSENDAGGPDESSYKLRSRPAIRQAAKVAKSKITETSLIQDHETPEHSPLTSAKSLRGDLYATPSPIEKPRRDLNASQASLFGPTPNNIAVFDFTLSEDDQLVTGLPRFGKETAATKVKTMKKPPGGDIEIVDLDDGMQPVFSFGLADEMSQCINTFHSTLRLIESDFKTRINQLKDQVDKMRRLLQWSRRGQAEGRKAQNSVPLW